MECGIAAGAAPLPITTVVVRQQCYPRVPPELLLREHTGRFRLTGFSLLSLLDTIAPQMDLGVLPFLSQLDVSDKCLRNLLRDIARRPQVPRDNIKDPGPCQLKLERETAEAKHQRNASTSVTASGGKEKLMIDGASYLFEEVASSYLSAVELVRKVHGARHRNFTNLENGGKGEKNCSIYPETGPRSCTTEDHEVLWGYNTGAVVHVNLHAFEADLSIRRQFGILSSWRHCDYIELLNDANKKLNLDGDISSVASGVEDGDSTLDSYNQSEEFDDHMYKMSECAPHGVSLLGYHPIGGVSSLVYAPHTDLAISGGADGILLVWDVHQRYRAELQERFNCDTELRNVRSTQQFSSYVRTRRLTQRIDHAHNSDISALATHCELLLSGGVDGTVKVWFPDVHEAHTLASRIPRYVERQVFHCGGWVRQIWCAPDRNVQGEDVLVVTEGGRITGFQGCTISQQTSTSLQFQQSERKSLSGVPRSPRETLNTLNGNNKRGSNGHGGGGTPKFLRDDKNAFKLINRGVVTRALCMTRRLQKDEISGLRECSSKAPLHPREEGANGITRIIPMVERNLFITLGYGATVQFVDMSRLSVTGVVKHPNLTLVGSDTKRDVAASSIEQPQRLRKGGLQLNLKNSLPTHAGGANALRFIDILYVNTHDYLLLLDSRNTVFVWDSVNNKTLTSLKIPETTEDQRRNSALRLLPCGTLHYGGGTSSSQHDGLYQKRHERKHSELCCDYKRKPSGLRRLSNTKKGSVETTNIPFFVVCSMSLELCEIVISAHSQLEFQAHQDPIVGIFLCGSPTPPLTEGARLHGLQHGGNVVFRKHESIGGEKKIHDSSQSCASVDGTSMSHVSEGASKGDDDDVGGKNTRDDKDGGDERQSEDGNIMSASLQDFVEKVGNGDQICVISSSVDGAICFWGHDFEYLRSYHYRDLSKGGANSCTVISCKLPSSDDAASPFDASSSVGLGEKNGTVLKQNTACHDITSFYFNFHLNLAVTGHDDGSVRYWPCDQQLARCVWHKRLHRNTVSGLTWARISKSEEQQRMLTRLGMRDQCAGRANTNELLATVSFDGHLAVWAYIEHTRVLLHARTRVSHNELLCVTFQSINELFIVGDSSGVVSSWSAQNLEPRCQIPSRPPSPWRPLTGKSSSFAGSAFSRRMRRSVAVEPTSTIQVGHTDAVTALVVDGNFVLSGGEDGRVFLWDLNRGTLIREYFLLHDSEAVAAAVGLSGARSSTLNICSQLVDGKKMNPCSSSSPRVWSKNLAHYRFENVTSILLLAQRRGDFLVATRECWIYRFKQNNPYPISTYEHKSSIRCMCILHEGAENPDNDLEGGKGGNNSLLQERAVPFDVVVGCEEGKISVVHETFFSLIVL